MTKRKLFLIVQSILCLTIAFLLAASAVRIYLEGSAYQAAGHPSEWIYTREKAISSLTPVLPLFLLSVIMTVFGISKGIRDSNADKPVRYKGLGSEMRNRTAPETAKKRILLRRVLLVAAVCFIVLGVLNGTMKDVLVKAIRICSECIGLG